MTDRNRIDMRNYSYELPENSIARYPLTDRDQSRLLFYDQGKLDHLPFYELPGIIPRDAWLVFNNTRVIQARLKFRKPTGAKIEIFCLEPELPSDYQQSFQTTSLCSWKCLVGNVKKWKEGPVFLNMAVENRQVALEARITGRSGEYHTIQFQWNDPGLTFGEILETAGETPIPPYLDRDAEETDRERYQTVYCRDPGSVAAPTAGLHFTDETINRLEQKGIGTGEITLHVGAGTFVPVKHRDARDHRMHPEMVVVSRSFLEQWMGRTGGVIAVGTTSTRSLESLYWLGVKLIAGETTDPGHVVLDQWEDKALPPDVSLEKSLGALVDFFSRHGLDQIHFSTRLMILPGYRFRTISGLLTNFHLPESSLLLLIAAWIGADWRKVYDYAMKHRFRFLSYGDSSLLIPGTAPGS